MYSVRIEKDSISHRGDRLTTMVCSYPRLIHSEMMTHRMMSRNSSSSRAIPVSKMIEQVRSDPVIPIFTAAQKGMQGGVLDEGIVKAAEVEWLEARNDAVKRAQNLLSRNVHKQNANRLLEPFSWITVIITATEWSNFFAQRVNSNAQPEIYKIALMMYEAYRQSTPVSTSKHMPFITAEDTLANIPPTLLRKIAVARCARVSYLTHDGKRDPEADLNLYEHLYAEGHWSPFEHVADAVAGQYANFDGWKSYRYQVSK